MKSFLCDLNSDIDDEFILFNLNSDKDKIQECLDIVKNYIIENNLMVVGGMSIDFALRLVGDKLYSDYSIPDYDIISPNNIEHANNIAKIICSKGFQNVSSVPAIHKTTVRVQVLGTTVFDATYVPEYIYNKIPFKQYENFKFIDPVYQKVDQYSSLSLLWNITGPSFNILNRLSKDIKRKDMLNKYYKFNIENNSNDNLFKKKLKNTIMVNVEEINNNSNTRADSLLINKTNFTWSKDKINIFNVNDNYYTAEPNITFHGKSAYCILQVEFKKITNKWNIKYDKNKLLDVKYYKHSEKNNIYNFEFLGKTVEFISQGEIIKDCFKIFEENTSKGRAIVKKYSHSHTALPSHYSYIFQKDNKFNVNVMDLTGFNLSLNHLVNEDHILFLANYNYILAYFLFNQYIEDDEYERYIYQQYYLSILYMVETIQSCEDYINYVAENKSDSLFLYSINNLNNDYKLDENYNFFIQNYKSLISEGKNLSSVPPKNYLSYPKCEINKIFSEEDRNNSEFYNDKKKEINETNYIRELMEIIT